MPAPVIGAGISAGAGLLGAGKQAQQQQNASNAASQAFGAEEQLISQMMANEPAVSKAEIQGLGNQLGNMGKSVVSTLRAGMGNQAGMANPGLALQSALGGAMQTGMQDTQALESQLGEQRQALLGTALSGLGGIGSTYANAAGAGGNPFGSAIGGLGSFIGMLGHPGSNTGYGANIPPGLTNDSGLGQAAQFTGGNYGDQPGTPGYMQPSTQTQPAQNV